MRTVCEDVLSILLLLHFVSHCFLRFQEVKPEQTTEASSRLDKREPRKTRPEKQIDRTVIPDARVRHLKDQLVRARVYLSLPSTRNNPHFTRELRVRMKEVQRAVGDASKDSELPRKYVLFRNIYIAS